MAIVSSPLFLVCNWSVWCLSITGPSTGVLPGRGGWGSESTLGLQGQGAQSGLLLAGTWEKGKGQELRLEDGAQPHCEQ